MLSELHIENIAIIEELDLQLRPGLIAFTGETGAGKSILVDAIEALLGGRTDSAMLRSGAERALVEGVFQMSEGVKAGILPILRREELLDEENRLTLGREIRQGGRSVARVNGRSVSASLLREIGEWLVDIHGQSEHLSLLRVSQHLDLLDRYALVDELLSAYQVDYQRLLETRRELAELRQVEQEAARRIDLLNFQINEIESARLRLGEEEELANERHRLANAESLASFAQQALLYLDEGTPEAQSITDLLGSVNHALASLSRLDPSQSGVSEQSQAAFDSLSDLAGQVRQYLEAIEFNPQRLDQVEERLALIHNLKRKYGESIQAVLDHLAELRRQMDSITHATERIQELEAIQANLLEALSEEAWQISQKRQAQARELSGAIEGELADLNMSHTQFKVDFRHKPDENGASLPDGRKVALDWRGFDQVEFLIAPNPGEGFKPLAKIASGGETSRLMLALKNVLARADNVPTLVFDEIDQGIGGRAGVIVGQKLWKLARQHQVLCITHLPQLAAFGEQHFQVEKVVHEGRTLTRVRALEGEARLFELAQMFGEISEGTLRSAHEILQSVADNAAAHT
ncbi:MAG: DNA repair protein RecN [Anaerolineales bacterium]|nr:DNA repair protein RecN [Anaerolineales bacterium]